MQLVEDGEKESLGPSVTYLTMPIWSSTAILNMDDYCHVFESRSQL